MNNLNHINVNECMSERINLIKGMEIISNQNNNENINDYDNH